MEESIDLGNYNEEDFSSREAMAAEIERDTTRVLEAKKQTRQEVLEEVEKEVVGDFPELLSNKRNKDKKVFVDVLEVKRLLQKLNK